MSFGENSIASQLPELGNHENDLVQLPAPLFEEKIEHEKMAEEIFEISREEQKAKLEKLGVEEIEGKKQKRRKKVNCYFCCFFP